MIEAELGAGSLIAEGTLNRPVIFTSVADDQFGGSGTFDTDQGGATSPLPGDWGGIYFGPGTSGSIDNALISFAGGSVPIDGISANFNTIEVHQADFRLSRSVLENNADGEDGTTRNGRGANDTSTVYVRGAQPVIVDNVFTDNEGAAISINANALRHEVQADPGRSTGLVSRYSGLADNHGPLIRLNRLDNNGVNGLWVRGEELTTKSLWDDTDIVHVLNGEVIIGNHHAFSGLTLQSSNSESLIIKATGTGEITATGTPVEIDDRIGGTLHILGTVGKPVVLTSLSDDSVGAGYTPDGEVVFNTNNSGTPTSGSPGQWRGLLLDEFSNDRNVEIIRESENPLTFGADINFTPAISQQLGTLAADQKSGDENSRLGFEVQGFISPTDPDDVDVYSFTGTAGTEVWIDIDQTDTTLDSVIEIINAAGTVVARSVRSQSDHPGNLNAPSLAQSDLLGGDHYTQNFRDAGLRYTLPGTAGIEGIYFIRVRSLSDSGNVESLAGSSTGKYHLQVRLQQVQEFPGSTVRFSDIRFAQTGIDVRGLPSRSPIVGEAAELTGNSFAGAQTLVNLLETDAAALGIGGELGSETDIDWYRFDLTQTGIEIIPGLNDSPGTIGVVFDIDYADKADSGDTTIAVYDESGTLIFIGRESNVLSDQPSAPDGSVDDLSRGSLGGKDPYIGPIHLTPGIDPNNPTFFYVAVMSDRQVPTPILGAFQSNATGGLTRLEPVTSVKRIIEDHIGFQGYSSNGFTVAPENTDGLFDISTGAEVGVNVEPFTLQDVALFIATDEPENDNNFGDDDFLYTADPFESRRWLTRQPNNLTDGVNDVQDIAIRSDGRFYGYQRVNDNDGAVVGQLVEIDPDSGAVTVVGTDNINGITPTPNSGDFPQAVDNFFNRTSRADQFTNSDEVDALAFRRIAPNVRGTTPTYDIYYSVRESGDASKLYRATEDGDASLRNVGGRGNFGVVGDIQPAGVTYETQTWTVLQPVQNNPPNITNIRIKSKIAGAAGGFTLVINRPNNTIAEVTGVNFLTNEIFINIGQTQNGAASAQAIVDALNSDDDSRQLVTAVVFDGNSNQAGDGANGTVSVGFFLTGFVPGTDGPTGPLQGRVTGLTFSNFFGTGNLFGVTDAGEFLEINPFTAEVINVVDAGNTIGVPGLAFEGLTLGPQNVENGIYQNTLFAVTETGQVVAFDTFGNGVQAFDGGDGAQVVSTLSGATDGFFTLTTDAGAFGRFTTDPLAVDAPASVSLNEIQTVQTIGAGTGGTFTLSVVDNVGAISSPRAVINTGDSSFDVQDAGDFPATPFVIQVEDEQMLVNVVTGNRFDVTRGHNGTAIVAHPDTSTVFEVKTTSLATNLTAPVLTFSNGDLIEGDTLLTVTDASALPAFPFTIRMGDEEMNVTNVVGNDLTVTRGANGTVIEFHPAGSDVTVVTASLQVVDGLPLPSAPGFNIRINGEDLRVTSVAGTTLGVIRGANGTTIGSHFVGSTVTEIQTTTPLAFDASNAQVEAALEALPAIGINNVQVLNGPLDGQAIGTPIAVEFLGDLAARDIEMLSSDSTRLIGNEVQELSLDPRVVGGTFALEFGGDVTGTLDWDVSAADLQAALRALPSVGPRGVVVSGTNLAAGALQIEFTGPLSDMNVADITVDSENLLQNEQQTITISGGPTSGDFVLDLVDPANTINGTSQPIAYNADATAVRNALELGIPELAGNILVTETAPLPGGVITIEFINGLEGLDIQQFAPTSNFMGGSAPTVIVDTVQTIDADQPIVTETIVGTPVDADVITVVDGVLSVRDALIALPNFDPVDIVAAGILPLPDAGVAVTIGGQYAGTTVNLFDVDNFLNDFASLAFVTQDPGGAGSSIMGVSGLNDSGAQAIGLVFSPLDFNLWHPTTLRSTDEGHGINDPADGSRDPSLIPAEYATPESFRRFNQEDGGVSYQFGLEPWVPPAAQTVDAEMYLRYLGGVNAQFGILNTDIHADLSSNPNIVGDFGNGLQGSYNLPGGALGTLTTRTFDLSGTVAADRPTLYFNYFLDTENHPGSLTNTDGGDPFRDSARVFVSADGGNTWILAASNNSALSQPSPALQPRAELPGFLSHLSDAGLNSPDPRGEAAQMVQELFDNTGQWRQARVDLSIFAGLENLQLRIDFSTAGSMNDPTLLGIDGESTVGDAAAFGEFAANGGRERTIRSNNNQFEGFFVDDFIIGYAERGEMVTGAPVDTSISDLQASVRTDDPQRRNGVAFPDLLTGPYQLEVRRTDEYLQRSGNVTLVGAIFDTNDDHTLNASETSFLSFETGSFIPGLGQWSVTSTNPNRGEFNIESGPTNPFNPFSIFQATPADLGGVDEEQGLIRFSFATDAAADTGLRFFIDGVPQRVVDNLNELPLGDPQLAAGRLNHRTVEFPFSSGATTFTWVFDDFTGNGGIAFVDDIQLIQGATGLAADQNRNRPQGMLMLHSNFITDSSVRGINVQPGATESGGSNPHPGSTINFPQVQQADQRYVPGVVIENNVIAGSSGIRFAGETNANPQRPLPFGRIVNNTLVGTGAGIGIDVVGRASPTIVNNLFTEFTTGINDGGIGTVIRSNFFQDAGGGVTGTDAIVAATGSPLFVDAARGNYYLQSGSLAIDSSLDIVQDRSEFVNFKTELGLGESPIVAPDRDVFGQLRIFSGDSPGGTNSQIRKDRGAIDRADDDAPYATLLNPIDNDTAGEDRDPTVTFVSVTNPLLENFTILLGDGRGPNAPFEGTGVDGLTVDDPANPNIVMQAVVVRQNGELLTQGVDYNVAYNELTGVLRLTPLSTLWEADSVYVVSLDNGLIADRAGNLLRSNQENGDTEFTIIIPDVGTDFGDAPDSYRTLLASNGARHTGADEALPKLGAIFDTEFDGIPSIGADGDDLDGDGQNDEDGLVVGAFSGTATTEGLFLAAGAANPTTDPGDVIAFLNPSDASGSVLPVTVRGDGILDAWFDFNRDGDFDDLNEYAITNVSVVDGVNQIRIMTPATASPGLTYARFRLSTDGISSPSGIAIGGEVEDYRVNILDVAEATLGEDAYTVSEDNTLDVDGVMLDSLLANDTLPSEEFIQPQVVIEGTPITGMPDTYRTMNGTVRVDDPVLGLFTYTPDLDFEGTDTFRYAVSTQRNEGPAFEANATFTTVTIDVIPFNAPPTFDVPVETDIFEDDPSTWLVPDYFDNVAGGDPAFGTDEDSQTVTFTITEISSVPADLMVADPDVSNPDAIEFFPATDAAGVAVYVITGTDDGTPAESVDRTVTVNVRPINDPPRFDPSVTGSADAASVDEAWEVAELVDPVSMLDVDGTITYTLREDVSLQTADGEPGYFIPFEQATGSGYNPIGLLDVFTVGPANEADPLVEGGGQTLSMGNVPTTTTLGGTLTLGMSNGQMGVFYRPPQDYNSLIGGPDTFEYSVVDDGESYINGALVSDPQSSTNIVEFVLNPVNDRPGFEFNLPPLDPNDPSGPRQPLEAVEDGGLTTIDSFAVQIAAGPLATAFDEVDAINGQRISFAVGLVGGSQSDLTELFSTPPEISPEGLLTFEPATDVFGVFNFAVIAQDTGAVDPNRGDVRTSITQTFTIEVLPVNDPPRVRPDALPLNFVIQEDGSINIFNIGDLGTNTPGLLDAFAVGPDNEGEDRTPGGNQTISLREPTPTQTQFGGSVEEILDNGQIIGLRYQPRENFVGTDSFVYTVTDDGITVDFGTGGVERPDPRIAFNTVSIEVQPVNNPPQYSGPANVTVSEDIGVTSVPNWATNVLAGPPTASDELATQDVFFTLTQVSGDSTLFTSSPVAVIDEQTGTASLDFETAPDANGVAVFEVTLTDVPTDDSDPITTTARTFTLTIDPVNDIPTFTPTLSEITVNEDSGPYPPPMTDPWAINISPGPADESDQSVRFEVAVPAGDEALFQQLPTVDDAGILRFLPATNANGTVDLTITAIDSAEAAAAPVVLRLIITPENDTPIAIADNFGNPGDLIESVDEDTILTISIDDILVNDIDPDINNPDDVLSVELPASGFSLNGALVTYDEATGIITYNPTISVTLQSLSGVEQVTDSFTYRAVDSTGARSNIVTVGLNVAGINDAPVAVDDNPTLNPDGPTTIEILNNDSDVDGDLVPSSIEVTLQPAFGAVEIDDEGVVTYTAFQSFPTVDVFRYRLRDDTGQFSNEALVTISANAAPIARDDQAGTFIGEPVTVNVAGNDEDPDRDPGAPNNGVDLTSIQIVSEPVGGDVVPLADGQIRYIPEPGFVGIDTFQYTIADLDGRVSSPGSVDVRVVSSRLQNPDLRFDVNDDGNISPIDALLVINHIARSGEPSIPVTNDDIGPNFYDVNGDQLISPIDALGVITELGRIVGSGEGEGLRDAFVNDPVPMDFLDSIAGDDDDDDEVRIEALDIAFGDLL
ncbi:MAG: tandem-95 repeat protein [Planctomycetota bacterium]